MGEARLGNGQSIRENGPSEVGAVASVGVASTGGGAPPPPAVFASAGVSLPPFDAPLAPAATAGGARKSGQLVSGGGAAEEGAAGGVAVPVRGCVAAAAAAAVHVLHVAAHASCTARTCPPKLSAMDSSAQKRSSCSHAAGSGTPLHRPARASRSACVVGRCGGEIARVQSPRFFARRLVAGSALAVVVGVATSALFARTCAAACVATAGHLSARRRRAGVPRAEQRVNNGRRQHVIRKTATGSTWHATEACTARALEPHACMRVPHRYASRGCAASLVATRVLTLAQLHTPRCGPARKGSVARQHVRRRVTCRFWQRQQVAAHAPAAAKQTRGPSGRAGARLIIMNDRGPVDTSDGPWFLQDDHARGAALAEAGTRSARRGPCRAGRTQTTCLSFVLCTCCPMCTHTA